MVMYYDNAWNILFETGLSALVPIFQPLKTCPQPIAFKNCPRLKIDETLIVNSEKLFWIGEPAGCFFWV